VACRGDSSLGRMVLWPLLLVPDNGDKMKLDGNVNSLLAASYIIVILTFVRALT